MRCRINDHDDDDYISWLDRQLINDISENGGLLGHMYYSQENSKLALVGTLARLKKIQRLEDGGIYVVIEGISKFYLRDVKQEKPYLKAHVQLFTGTDGDDDDDSGDDDNSGDDDDDSGDDDDSSDDDDTLVGSLLLVTSKLISSNMLCDSHI